MNDDDIEFAMSNKGTVNWGMLRFAQRKSYRNIKRERITIANYPHELADKDSNGDLTINGQPFYAEVNVFLDVKSGLLYQGITRYG